MHPLIMPDHLKLLYQVKATLPKSLKLLDCG